MNKALCVLGMHRSGTSAFTRGLGALGVFLGETFLPANESNPKGHWEHQGIYDIQSELLKVLFVDYDHPNLLLPDKWWTSEILDSAKNRIKHLVMSEFVRVADVQVWGWKDPRTCITLPIWQAALSEVGIPIDYIIMIRNPLDSARSLEKRDGIPLQKALSMWLLYTLSALHYSRGSRRMVVHYDNYLLNWKNTLYTVADWAEIPEPDESILTSFMDNFLEPTLRHHQSSLEALEGNGVPSMLKRLYELCLDAAEDRNILDSVDFCNEVDSMLEDFRFFSRSFVQEASTFNISLYWASDGQFSDECSTGHRVNVAEEFMDLEFHLPETTVSSFAVVFNFAYWGTVVDVFSIFALSGDGTVVKNWSERAFHGVTASAGMLGIDESHPLGMGTGLRFIAVRDHGIIRLDLGEELRDIRTLKLTVRLHFENSTGVTRAYKRTASQFYDVLSVQVSKP